MSTTFFQKKLIFFSNTHPNFRLLVGAPLAQTDQPNVEHGGAVYRCSIDSINTCQQITFDRTGPSVVKIKGRDYQEDEKSNQWFGATLHSTPEGPIVVRF